jgi:hypothetical protein
MNELFDAIIDAKVRSSKMIIPAAAFQSTDAAAAPAVIAPNTGYLSSNMSAIAPIVFPIGPGTRVTGARVYVRDSSAPCTVQAALVRADKTGTATIMGVSPTSAGDGSEQALEIAMSPYSIPSDDTALYITVIRQSAGMGNVSVFSAAIDWDRL